MPESHGDDDTHTPTNWWPHPVWLVGWQRYADTLTIQCYIIPLGDREAVPNNPCRPLGWHTDRTKAVARKTAQWHVWMALVTQTESDRKQLWLINKTPIQDFLHIRANIPMCLTVLLLWLWYQYWICTTNLSTLDNSLRAVLARSLADEALSRLKGQTSHIFSWKHKKSWMIQTF